jgi:hypothetical protein
MSKFEPSHAISNANTNYLNNTPVKSSLYNHNIYGLKNVDSNEITKSTSVILKCKNSPLMGKSSRINNRNNLIKVNDASLMLKSVEHMEPSCMNATEYRRLMRFMRGLNINLDKVQLKNELDDYKQDIKNQWKYLAKVIDIIMLYIFVISTLGMIVLLARQVPDLTLF